jgi:hypothetical protein
MTNSFGNLATSHNVKVATSVGVGIHLWTYQLVLVLDVFQISHTSVVLVLDFLKLSYQADFGLVWGTYILGVDTGTAVTRKPILPQAGWYHLRSLLSRYVYEADIASGHTSHVGSLITGPVLVSIPILQPGTLPTRWVHTYRFDKFSGES